MSDKVKKVAMGVGIAFLAILIYNKVAVVKKTLGGM